jgi:dTDP-4-dehydrorhamnose reductase
MNKDILILGNGFIGKRLQDGFGCRLSGKFIRTLSEAEDLIKKFKPKVIINCIGITGKRNVDDCELEKDATLLANSFVPMILAEAALRNNVKLVHISSGCIYHYDYAKDSPVCEDKTPDFFDLFYSRSKIYSDAALNILASRYPILIVRIRIPVDDRPGPKNTLDKIIRYRRVIDVENSVTYIPDMIKALRHLMKINARGIYNVVNKGGLRYARLLEAYKKYFPDFKFTVVPFNRLKLVRTNLLMSTRKLEKSGFKVRNINSVLEECVKGYIRY